MTSVGEQLRSARLALDLQLEELSGRTKIRAALLRGLEEDNYKEFPNDFYLFEFLRQYARALELNEEETVAVLKAKLRQESGSPAESNEPNYSPSQMFFLRSALSKTARAFIRNVRRFVTTLVAAALIGVGWYAWYYTNWRGGPGSTSSGGAVPGVQDAAPGVAVVKDASQETIGVVGKDAEASAGVVQSARADVAESLMEITIQAADRVWVRSLADGTTERETILQAGERQQFEADSLVQVTIGSAGAATLMVDGETLGVLGSAGQMCHLRITRNGWSFTENPGF